MAITSPVSCTTTTSETTSPERDATSRVIRWDWTRTFRRIDMPLRTPPPRYIDRNGLQFCGGVDGTVRCDGHDGFKPFNCNWGCTRQCTQRHEERHVNDFYFFQPELCVGQPPNASPYAQLNPRTRRRDEDIYECRASRDSIDCANSILNDEKMCALPACKQEAQRYKEIHEIVMRKDHAADLVSSLLRTNCSCR